MGLTMTWVAGVAGILAALAWCGLYLGGAWAVLRVRELRAGSVSGPLPGLSVIVAACNEAETIGPALRSLLAQDYPALQVVVVDDRSMDGTGTVVGRVASADPRVTGIRVDHLPDGWLGKVNALHTGMSVATGEFVLFADADVQYRPGALAAAVAYMQDTGLDHLTLLPRLHATSLMHAALMQAFFVGYVRRAVLSERPFGYGAFNLVRRDAFDRTEGFEWLRMEVVDDVAVGAMMRAHGFRSECAIAPDLLELLWYPDARAALHGFEKNVFGALARYRLDLMTVFVLGSAWLAAGPFLPPLAMESAWAWAVPALAVGALAVQAVALRARLAQGVIAGLLEPVANLVIAWALLMGGTKCLIQKGIYWRGTFYPLAALRAGRRVSFP